MAILMVSLWRQSHYNSRTLPSSCRPLDSFGQWICCRLLLSRSTQYCCHNIIITTVQPKSWHWLYHFSDGGRLRDVQTAVKVWSPCPRLSITTA